jgi:hypothetical protein
MMKSNSAHPKPRPARVPAAVAVALLTLSLLPPPAAHADDPNTRTQTATQTLTLTVQKQGVSKTTQKLQIAVLQIGTATATQTLKITVAAPEAISLTLNKTALALSGSPNVFLADHLTANVITDNPTGFVLSIEAAEPRLKCATSNDYIEPLSTAGSMSDNHWGWAYDSGVSPTAAPEDLTWNGVAAIQTEIKNSPTATDVLAGEDIRIWFGTKVNFSLPACIYSGGTKISAVMNP